MKKQVLLTTSDYILYNSDVHRLRRADVQYTSPPTMLFTIGLSERAILVIRLKIDLRITQVQELHCQWQTCH